MCIDELLESRLQETNDVYVGRDEDAESYFKEVATDIREHRCKPFYIRALVMPPGLPGYTTGDYIEALCVAKRPGYWLAYDEKKDVFYAFWGETINNLGAHGVIGSPIYCWTA